MADCNGLQDILSKIAEDVAERSNTQVAADAFDAYWQCLKPLAKPYVRDGFLEKDKALPRFLSETATLHLAVSLIPQWCTAHGFGHAEDFWSIHHEARFFSWYETPQPLLSSIRTWATAHSEIDDVLQAMVLAAENSLVGLRRRSLGEFFTPTKIAQHLVSLAGCDLLTLSRHTVADPACGNGNLLAAVVANTVQAVASGLVDPDVAIADLGRHVYGFDIQPIAVLLTRLQLLLVSLPILRDSRLRDQNIYEVLSFPYIQLRDPLSSPESFWDLFAPFDIIVGNPPFLKAVKRQMPSVANYEEILAGQPNLYQLFLWWAIRATRTGGRIAFLVPQSIRAGQYLRRLRQQITQTCEITAITSFADRTGVFDSVDQQVMIVALRKSAATSHESPIAVRVSANGQSLGNLPTLNVPQHQLVRAQDDAPVWCVSSERTDYAIMARVCDGQRVLKNAKEFKILNGGFVWNQHKENLRSVEMEGSLPLVSSASLGVHQFVFPPSDQRVRERLFVHSGPPLAEPIYENRTVLLKRTTPQKLQGRRVVAATLPDAFLIKYPCYFVENHVNLICMSEADTHEQCLLGLAAWLNSRLANFIFGMMNGSSHLSKFELELMPAPKPMLAELGNIASSLPDCSATERHEVMALIDKFTFEFFGLSPDECRRIAQVVPLPG